MENFSNHSVGILPANSVYINNLIYELKATGKDIITMSLGEAFFDIPLFDFSSLPFPECYHYSNSRGIIELRKKLSEYHKDHYETQFDPQKEILITSGSKIAIYMVFLSLLTDGDEVVIPEPYWVSYTEQVKLCRGVPVTIPYYERVENYPQYITHKTKCIVINNPHNPSGKLYSKDELIFLLDICRKHDIYLISDEAYSDFVLDKSFYSLGFFDKKYEHSIVVNSISKNFGISGWRLGYVISHQRLIDLVVKLNQHLITCPPTILEYYVARHFDTIIETVKPQIRDLLLKRQEIATYMSSLGLQYLEGSSTFYFFVSLAHSSLSSTDFSMKLLEEKNVSVVPGIGYGKSCDKYVRVAIGAENVERITKGIKAIHELIEETSS